MASPAYDAKYRKHDDAPGRVIPAPLLSPDLDSTSLGSDGCEGSLAVGDEQYEPWGTPHGGVIAELAARCMAAQAIASARSETHPWLVTSSYQFRRRWTRGEPVQWSTRPMAIGSAPGSDARMVSVTTTLTMAGAVVTEATGTLLVPPGHVTPTGSAEPGMARYLADLPCPTELHLPSHHAGWSAGAIAGYFDEPPTSLFVAADEAMAAAANTVRGDVFGDERREDFLLADMDVTLTGDTASDDSRVDYQAVIRRGRSGRDGMASARLTRGPRVFAYARGRVVFLHAR